MRIGIVGPGAMGCLFAGLLTEGGCEVLLIDHNPDRAREISSNGITIERDGALRTIPVKATADPADAATLDGAVFMVKAYSTDDAAARLKDYLPPASWVMALQNGMGNVELLQKYFGSDRVLAGTSSDGATLKGPGQVRHAGRGETRIGELDGCITPRVDEFSASLKAAGFQGGMTGNVTGLLWKKLIINVGINPITALLRIRNGEILDSAPALEVSHAAALEAAAVSRAACVDTGVSDPAALVEEICRKTAANISSMRQDIEAGRRTEIDFISGFVVDKGAVLGIQTPVNSTLRNLVSALEKKPVESK